MNFVSGEEAVLVNTIYDFQWPFSKIPAGTCLIVLSTRPWWEEVWIKFEGYAVRLPSNRLRKLHPLEQLARAAG